jgi:hypothetical protein
MAELQRVLSGHGVGCDGYEEAAPAQRQKFVDQQAYCQIQGESADVYVFKTPADLTSWIRIGVEAGCSFGFPEVAFVRGPNWIVQPETTALTQVIQARVGGKVEVHQCSG